MKTKKNGLIKSDMNEDYVMGNIKVTPQKPLKMCMGCHRQAPKLWKFGLHKYCAVCYNKLALFNSVVIYVENEK